MGYQVVFAERTWTPRRPEGKVCQVFFGPSSVGKCWVLVSEPGFVLGFGGSAWNFKYFIRNEAQDQPSLLDTIFDYIFYFGPPGKYLYLSPENLLHVGRRTSPANM